MILAELLELVLPRIPELGKSVHEEHELAGAGLRVVETHAVDVGVVVHDRRGGESRRDYCEQEDEGPGHGRDSMLADVLATGLFRLFQPLPRWVHPMLRGD